MCTMCQRVEVGLQRLEDGIVVGFARATRNRKGPHIKGLACCVVNTNNSVIGCSLRKHSDPTHQAKTRHQETPRDTKRHQETPRDTKGHIEGLGLGSLRN